MYSPVEPFFFHPSWKESALFAMGKFAWALLCAAGSLYRAGTSESKMFPALATSIILENVRNKQNEPNVIKMETAYNLVTHLEAQSFGFFKKKMFAPNPFK